MHMHRRIRPLHPCSTTGTGRSRLHFVPRTSVTTCKPASRGGHLLRWLKNLATPSTYSLSRSFGLTQCRREEGTRSPTWKRSWRNAPGRWNSSTSRWAVPAASSLHAVNAVRHHPAVQHHPSQNCPLAFHRRALAQVDSVEPSPRQGALTAGRAVHRSALVEGVHSPAEAHIRPEVDHPPGARSRPMISSTLRCEADLSRSRCRCSVG